MINLTKLTRVSLLASVAAFTMGSISNAQDVPYEEVPGVWAKLPDGRKWGSTSTVYYAGNGNIWAAERCGGNGTVWIRRTLTL